MFSDLDSDGDINMWHPLGPTSCPMMTFQTFTYKGKFNFRWKNCLWLFTLAASPQLAHLRLRFASRFSSISGQKAEFTTGWLQNACWQKTFFPSGTGCQGHVGLHTWMFTGYNFQFGADLCFDSCPCFRCRVYKRLATV